MKGLQGSQKPGNRLALIGISVKNGVGGLTYPPKIASLRRTVGVYVTISQKINFIQFDRKCIFEANLQTSFLMIHSPQILAHSCD